MSQARREEAATHLRYLRIELREIALILTEDGVLPDSGEIKALYSQLEALLLVVEGAKKKKKPVLPRELKAA